jgi:DNA recombination protein RmuC
MSIDTVVIILVFLAGLGLVYVLLRRRPVADSASMSLMLERIDQISRTVDHKIGETNKEMSHAMRSQFSESQKLVDQFLRELGQMTEKVTRVEETGKQMVGFASELQSLGDLLKNPKQRGVLGEYYLETLLKNVLPPGSYQMQYPFPDGTIVDAVVFVKDKIIPVDSKFSLENYNRMAETRDPGEHDRLEKLFVNDLKNRIVETSKYIQPDKNTTEFAFMFIPHEAIYYDLLINKVGALTEDTENLVQRAAGKYKVIIVSPTSFLAYLQTVLQGLKAMQIEETAKEIKKRVEELGKHLGAYSEYHEKLGNALGTVVNHYNASGKAFKQIDKDVLRVAGTAPGLDTKVLEKPDMEE